MTCVCNAHHPPRLADDARRPGQDPRPGLGRAGRSADVTPRRDSKWWGWGDPAVEPELDGEALGTLRERVGELEPWPLATELERFELPEAEAVPQALIDVVGEVNVFAGTEDRVRHATGCGYSDLARLRGGRLDAAPDAVLLPGDADTVRRVLEICAAEGIAVVPYGGGTSVVGGIEPLRGSHSRLVSLDLARLRDVEVDERSLTARLGAGLRGPEAEAALNAEGVVLGHFPQSFEYATIGGFAATRSAGQASSGYGRFDALVSSVRLIAPEGDLRTLETPHTAAGPALREVVIGSEGTFGVIPEVTVRVRPAPQHRRYEAWIAESFEAGAEIVRALAQGPGLPDVIRVSDEEETEVSLALSGPRGLDRQGLRRLSRSASQARGLPDRRRARGGRGVGRPPARPRGTRPAPRRRRLPGPERRPILGARSLSGPLPARHADGDGGDGRDAGDLAHLVAARRAARGRRRRDPRLARRPGHAGPGLLPPLARLRRRRLALLHLHLPRAARRRDRAVARRSSAPPARRSSPPAARSPTTTPSAATTPPT